MGKVLDVFAGKKPKAPTPINAQAAAADQGAANLTAANQTANINRPDQVTPYGTLSWTQGGGNYNATGYESALKAWQDAGGTGAAPTKESFGYDPTKWTSNISMSQENQDLLMQDFQNRLAAGGMTGDYLAGTNADKLASSDTPIAFDKLDWLAPMLEGRYGNLRGTADAAAGQAASGRQGIVDALSGVAGLDTGGLSYAGAPAMPTANEATRQAIADSLYGQAVSRLDPRFQQEENATRSRLAAQGIPQGSEAYNTEFDNFGRTKNDAYQTALNNASVGSLDAMQSLFGMGMQARQQGVAEANNLYQMPIANELARLNLQGSLGSALDTAGRDWQGIATQNELAKDASGNAVLDIRGKNFSQNNENRMQILREILGMTGLDSGPRDPNFNANNNVASVEANPVLEALMAQMQQQLGVYNSKMSSRNATINALSSVLGAAAGGYFGA